MKERLRDRNSRKNDRNSVQRTQPNKLIYQVIEGNKASEKNSIKIKRKTRRNTKTAFQEKQVISRFQKLCNIQKKTIKNKKIIFS